MAAMDSQDTEITLGTVKLLGLFFGLVMICAVFFALGYSLGRKSEVGIASAAVSSPPLQTSSNASKPAGSPSQPAQPMTFYKAVEQKDANAQLTPASASTGNAAASTDQTAPTATPAPTTASPGAESSAGQGASPPDPLTMPAGNYFVQVAAVSKQEDAEALVDALKQKQYPAFIAGTASSDKLFHVQLGPFGDIKDAEATRTKLINDGYNPIVKK
jgi:DedD protein